LKEKSLTFRPETWLDELIKNTMGVHRIKTKSEAIHYLLKETENLRVENKQLRENNGHNGHTLNNDSEQKLNGDHFDCNLLCAKFKGCTSHALYYLVEIDTLNCFVPNFPQYCHFLLWEKGNPHGDPNNPYPKCLDPKPPIAIPKDRIITNPQLCWRCMKIKKDHKEERSIKRAIGDRYRNEPRVYYPNEGAQFPSEW
jgi:hypothetical protein